MQTITRNQLKELDSTIASIEVFQRRGWTLTTHHMEITTGMRSHLNNWHRMQPQNGIADIEAAIVELAPELA